MIAIFSKQNMNWNWNREKQIDRRVKLSFEDKEWNFCVLDYTFW